MYAMRLDVCIRTHTHTYKCTFLLMRALQRYGNHVTTLLMSEALILPERAHVISRAWLPLIRG